MARLIPRATTSRTPIAKACRILALPAELRLLIYSHLVPGGFLPNAHHKTYIGLLLSCSQIYHEMATESVRLAPLILHEIQDTAYAAPMKLRPLRPINLASSMHITVGIPRWAMRNRPILSGIVVAIISLLELHLASLTIGIEEHESEYDVWQMFNIGFPLLMQYFMHGVEARGAVFPPGYTTNTDHYRERTAYSDIITLAMSMNCLFAPGICNGNHLPENNAWCLRRPSRSSRPPLPENACNIRRIVFCLKRLHNEDHSVAGGQFRRLVYPFGIESMRQRGTTTSLRSCPTTEVLALLEEGWEARWIDEMGIKRRCSRRKPGLFVWKKLGEKPVEKSVEKPPGRVKKALEWLFKRS